MQQSNMRQAMLLTRVLTRALQERARVTRSSDHASDSLNQTVSIATSDTSAPVTLVPVPAGAGYPQDVRLALPRLATLDRTVVPVLVARRMSPGARRMLDDAKVAWADEDGNVRVVAGPVVVALDAPVTAAPPLQHPGDMRWAEATGAIAELLLGRAARGAAPEELEGVTAIASRLGLSAPLVSRSLQRFDAAGWTQRSGPSRGPQVVRRLVNPGAMLSSWAAWRTSRHVISLTAHALIQDVDSWLRDLRQTWPSSRWAVTGEAAAQIRAPYLSRVSLVEIYLDPTTYDDDLDDLLHSMSLARVETGGRVRLLRADPYLPALVADGEPEADIPLVPDIRLYGDLLAGGVRGDEAAGELRDRRIGF